MVKEKIPTKLYCIGCGRQVETKNFWLNYNEIHKEYHFGRHYYCKSCTKMICTQIMDKYWKAPSTDKVAYDLGMRAICNFFDMPYVSSAVNELMETEFTSTKERNWDYVYQYSLELKAEEIDEEYWNDLSKNAVMGIVKLKVAKPNQDGDYTLLMGLKDDWGIQDNLEDYAFLEQQFREYAISEELMPFVEGTIRRLCLASLDYKNARKNKADQVELKKIEDKINDYGKKLGLDKPLSSNDKSAGAKSIMEWADILEKTQPIESYVKSIIPKDLCNIDGIYKQLLRCYDNVTSDVPVYPDII